MELSTVPRIDFETSGYSVREPVILAFLKIEEEEVMPKIKESRNAALSKVMQFNKKKIKHLSLYNGCIR